MGASTGNMLVDRLETLENIFKHAPLPIMTHCEDTQLINQNMAEANVCMATTLPWSIIQQLEALRLATIRRP